MTDIKVIVNLFNVNMRKTVNRQDRNRWLAVLTELSRYDQQAIEDEYEMIFNLVGEKPTLYYMEGVRRQLMIKENNTRKREKMPQQIKDMFK